MKCVLFMCLAVMLASPAAAQDEGQLRAEFRREGEKLRESCGEFDVSAVGSCAFTILTANPLHLSVGSIAPGNGVSFGPALVGHHTPNERLRITWSTDAVVAPSGAWRGGAYLKFIPTTVGGVDVVFDENAVGDTPGIETYPVFSIYGQAISLERLQFFGLGPDSSEAARSNWTMRQNVFGGRALYPVPVPRLGLALLGEINARFVRVGASADGSTPPIDQVFSPALVPGLGDDRRFWQFGGGIRMSPAVGIRVRPTYEVRFDGFRGEGDADQNFSRWTVDLTHEFPFYRTTRPKARTANTPNDCSVSVSDHACPAPSRNRYGAVSIRFFTIGSEAASGDTIPFYMQPTLGGSDINGDKLLTSFDDYRFRGANAFAFQATVEHTLPALNLGRGITLPFGAFFMIERGRVADQWSDLFSNLEPSYAAGLTIRAGGFPEIYLLFGWGGETRHFMGTINPALLGGTSRPPLY